MSLYRFLEDASVGQNYYQAGTQASTQDVGGTLPTGWIPNGNIDPLDAGALAAFYAKGPQPLGLVRPQFSTISVVPPTTYWKATVIAGSAVLQWSLTGLGVGLPPISM